MHGNVGSAVECSEFLGRSLFGGSLTGSLDDWGAGRLRRLRAFLGGKAPSSNEYHGS